MNSLKFLTIMIMTLFSIEAFAQAYESENGDFERDEETISSRIEKEYAPDQVERQEDTQYPVNEENDWSLGSEESAVEEQE